MTRRAAERGLTLIEILLALIVLVLGMVGILSLFPAAMQSGVESMEDTNAAILGESVAQALANAVRHAVQDPATKQWVVELSCDGAGDYKGTYKFMLPKLVDPWPTPPAPPPARDIQFKYFPSKAPAYNDPVDPGIKPPTDLEGGTALDLTFKLGRDQWSNATTKNVKDNYDTTDSYTQFGWAFTVKNVNNLEYKLLQKNPVTGNNFTTQDIQVDCRAFDFEIYIFRTGTTAGAISGGGGSGTAATGTGFRRLITVLTKRITVK